MSKLWLKLEPYGDNCETVYREGSWLCADERLLGKNDGDVGMEVLILLGEELANILNGTREQTLPEVPCLTHTVRVKPHREPISLPFKRKDELAREDGVGVCSAAFVLSAN